MYRSLVLVATFLLALSSPALVSAQHETETAYGRCGFDIDDRGFYTFEDFQYFKPPVADIRTPRHVARLYEDTPLPYSGGAQGVDSTSTHAFFDGSFGETFPFLGWNLEEGEIRDCMSAAGVATFFQASAHVLIDLVQSSNPVMNTDYRIGFGLSGRPLKSFRPLAFKVHLFHESTHIGDEYVLEAAEDPAFRRWNVSYEAVEVLGALDYFDPGGSWGWPAYMRVYGGGKRLTSFFNVFEPFRLEFDQYLTRDSFGQTPLLLATQWEAQTGAEFFLQAWPSDHLGHGHFWKWQYSMAAVDVSRVNRLDVADPESVWSTHAMIGLVWGAHFNAQRSNQLTVDWYRGVNPHGQFRTAETDWIGLTLTLRF
ncbi:MAG: DUF1207 domain-containing protein [Gemmatimonadota bacterium]|nr:DUF1207 domain-containing protein [Gemmatimonadota bacterium]